MTFIVSQGIVDAKVCWNAHGNACYWNSQIKIKNCHNYYVYKLPKSPACNGRYCTTESNRLNPCTNATVLTDPTRSIYNSKGNLCDDNFKNIWYRFNGSINSQMMATGKVDENKCGTYATGWLTRNHPTSNDYMF